MTKVLADNLTEQLRLAGLVQQDFLPAKLPNTDEIRWSTIFLPAEWVSGDIYDIVRIDEQHIGFYVADIVGHGMPAALDFDSGPAERPVSERKADGIGAFE